MEINQMKTSCTKSGAVSEEAGAVIIALMIAASTLPAAAISGAPTVVAKEQVFSNVGARNKLDSNVFFSLLCVTTTGSYAL
ncbi:hypothetical protein HNY73_011184 [Argiope bruennichi]|uniref:Uncharacterized protein n=1 Tax=Argiope bruennichi TaxID=94029 RepID=A0A8T0F8B3_ARGBR|nr:hypothetical protein HNY73_011184 [Argiope bruennichi]